MTKKFIETEWALYSYDVLGNEDGGFEVNDVYPEGKAELTLEIEVHNPGTEHEFRGAYPTDDQIREALGIKADVELEVDGDDRNIYVNSAKDGYPLGEMRCISHKSLSPIRE